MIWRSKLRKVAILLFSLAFFIAVFAQNPIQAQVDLQTNSDSIKFHTEDISLFWKVFDETSPKFNKDVFQKKYLEAGSPGLKSFVKMRIESGKNLSKIIKQDLVYYKEVRKTSLSLNHNIDSLYRYFYKFKEIYSGAAFPDVYFVIGAKNTAGTAFNKGIVIGVEMFGIETTSFKPRLDIALIDLVVMHEFVHFQQNYAKSNTLLAQCIREGAADFICELVTGSHSNKLIYEYGNRHEKELWLEFEKNMHNQNWSPWLYYSKDNTRPKDLGYWMGYKICEVLL